MFGSRIIISQLFNFRILTLHTSQQRTVESCFQSYQACLPSLHFTVNLLTQKSIMNDNSNSALETALKKIKTASLGGVAAVVGQILIQLASHAIRVQYELTDQRLSAFSYAFLIFESILVLALCYGIYKRNKVCAIMLLIFSALVVIFKLMSGGLDLIGIILVLVAFQGIRGILAYQRLTSQKNQLL